MKLIFRVKHIFNIMQPLFKLAKVSQPPKCLDKNSTYFAFQNIGEYHEEETHLDS